MCYIISKLHSNLKYLPEEVTPENIRRFSDDVHMYPAVILE